ncbi:MAG TPA: glutathione S-transferase family protein [Candidatus Polarisedimenticolia bacterium]|jgi:glutathione S-transferase|nr:glutathione S-transferase family protein [Candidatus Polarisedimenticolia bacterium]
MAIVLYEIFWSHFCEKARFCLDFKRLPYRIEAVNPFTRRQAIRAGGRGHVPVLRDGGLLVEGSNAIAAYLEEARPDPPLLPRDASERSEVLALERQCDEVLGPDARRVGYQVAFENPSLFLGTLLWSRPPGRWLNGPMLRLLEPRLRRKFKVHPMEIAESRQRLRLVLAELQSRVAAGPYLVGRALTLADIAAVSLLDPLEIVPEFVRDRAYAPLFAWKRGLARAHGRRQRTPWLSDGPPPGYPLPDVSRS